MVETVGVLEENINKKPPVRILPLLRLVLKLLLLVQKYIFSELEQVLKQRPGDRRDIL
jgi:hypothetical protein